MPNLVRAPSGVWLLVAVALLGVWRAGQMSVEETQAACAAEWAEARWLVALDGVLAEEPRPMPEGVMLVLREGSVLRSSAGQREMPLRARVVLRGDAADGIARKEKEGGGLCLAALARGDRVRAVGHFRAIRPSGNPIPYSRATRCLPKAWRNALRGPPERPAD
jgi:hypothetical protein